MEAYRLFPDETQLRLVKVEIPRPSVEEVLIKVQACGLCHSDCHIMHGAGWVKRPRTLGHEVAGEIVGLGEGVFDVQLEDRVAVALMAPSSGIGLDFDGGFARYALAPAQNLVHIPPQVSFEQAAVATDAALTAYNAVVVEAKVDSATTVAILGLGGLGLFGLRFATLQGATVYGIDTDESKFEPAYASGAKSCANSLDCFKDVVFDVIVDFVGLTATVAAAVRYVKWKGRIVLVGLGDTELNLPTFPIVFKQLEIKGSLGGSKDELVVVLDLIAAGKIAPSLKEIPFSEVCEGYRRLESGQVKGRLFTRPYAKTSIDSADRSK